jgi:hypothetical protein
MGTDFKAYSDLSQVCSPRVGFGDFGPDGDQNLTLPMQVRVYVLQHYTSCTIVRACYVIM